jgi:membrane protease YdiL (CAAX protease family)
LRLSSTGFRRPDRGTLWAIPAGVALFMGIPLIYFVIFPLLHLQMNTTEMGKLLATPFWYRLLLVTRAAFREEVLFRGYPIPRLEELSGRTGIAAVVSWTAFRLAHLGSWRGGEISSATCSPTLSATAQGFCCAEA